MKVTFIAFTSLRGGAAKAAVRFQRIINNFGGYDVSFVTVETDDSLILSLRRVVHFAFWVVSQMLTKLQIDDYPVKKSLNIFGNKYIQNKIKESTFVHVHWINNETVSIKDIPLLSKKAIITLHDEWFYCGAEHHALSNKGYQRVIYGYSAANKNIRGVDLNKLIWNLKKKYYSSLHDVVFTVPSSWMKSRAERSYLLKGRDIRVIPNPIDTNLFKNQNKEHKIKGVNEKDFVILFGAVGGRINKLKGYDLLLAAISKFSNYVEYKSNIKIIIFGSKYRKCYSISDITAIEIGVISSEEELAKIYSSVSITVVPSRAESFGQVAAESLSCGTPVVCFGATGLTDIVKHKINGFLACPFDPTSLCEGILWLYNLSGRDRWYLGANGRRHIIEKFSENVVAKQLISLYNEKKRLQ